MTDDQEVITPEGVDSPSDEQSRKMIKALREEAAARRVAAREEREKREQAESDLAAAMERLNALERQAKDEADRGRKVLEELKATNEAAVSGLPERLRVVVPEGLDPIAMRRWLDAAVPVLMTSAPNLEGAAGAGKDRGNGDVAVSPEIAALARSLGVDPQELAKRTK